MTDARRALVTGGNRGIGREICRQLIGAGVEVVLTSRTEEAGKSAAAELGADYLTLDVTDVAQVSSLPDRLGADLDILVNNAGVALDGFDAAIAQRTIDANFFGPMRVSDALRPRFREDAGNIVMVSSGMGELSCLGPKLRARFSDVLERDEVIGEMERFVREVGEGTHSASGWPSSAYRVSKVGLNAYTRWLARELEGAGSRIRVNAVCPGWVRTDMGGASADRSVEEGAKTPVWLALQAGEGPTGGFFRDEAPIAW